MAIDQTTSERKAQINRLCNELFELVEDTAGKTHDEYRELFAPLRNLDMVRHHNEETKSYIERFQKEAS